MEQITSRVTIFFEEPFWVGLYERENKGRYEVCRILFGAEPKDYEVYEYLLKNWVYLRFSPSIDTGGLRHKTVSPKRLQRDIKKQIHPHAMGTKAQQALKLQHEQGKVARKSITKQQKEAEKERRFELHEEKRKAKHRGH